MYFGSVRFFKNLILAFIIIAIGLGAGFALHYHHNLVKTQEELDSLKGATSQFLSQDALGNISFSGEKDLPYQNLYPEFYAPRTPVTTEQPDNVIYLTFNEGPTAQTTAILSALAQSNVKATFFVTAQDQGEEAKEALRAIADAGHTIGLLSWSNNYSVIYSSVEAYLDDMNRLFTYIQDTTGVTPSVFRFPGGSLNSYNTGLYQELIAEMLRRGFVPFDWNISAQDTSLETAAEVSNRVVSLAETMPRSIVLLHSTGEVTADAIKDIVEPLKENGFLFAPLTEEVRPILFSYR